MPTWQVVLLGLLEGLTEFIPVSSTGHILLAGQLLGFDSPGKTFEVLIQLGAILAILTVYFGKILRLLIDIPRDARTRRFVLAVLLAFLPAAVIGAVLHKFIKEILFNSPMTICLSLVIGGVVLLIVDKMRLEPRYHDAMDIPLGKAIAIGFCQCLAMIPGVSRSGSTIVGALLLGTDKRAATEFSFFLAMPTMAGAFAYDLMKNYATLQADDVRSIAIGFVVAFVSGVFVVRYLLDFVSRHGFAPFAWWRILVGGIGLGALLVLGA
ncbi:MAG: undecaprenyl-diphosphate phosphatase [Hyphomicrobiales bacterium]|nr:MAG: undecaprenyl-diphosphate phosphatase [Hyphomicrobiales bacterium]